MHVKQTPLANPNFSASSTTSAADIDTEQTKNSQTQCFSKSESKATMSNLNTLEPEATPKITPIFIQCSDGRKVAKKLMSIVPEAAITV